MTIEAIEALNAREKAALVAHLELELQRPVPEYAWPIVREFEVYVASVTPLRLVTDVFDRARERAAEAI